MGERRLGGWHRKAINLERIAKEQEELIDTLTLLTNKYQSELKARGYKRRISSLTRQKKEAEQIVNDQSVLIEKLSTALAKYQKNS